jgi:hypothetical protein
MLHVSGFQHCSIPCINSGSMIYITISCLHFFSILASTFRVLAMDWIPSISHDLVCGYCCHFDVKITYWSCFCARIRGMLLYETGQYRVFFDCFHLLVLQINHRAFLQYALLFILCKGLLSVLIFPHLIHFTYILCSLLVFCLSCFIFLFNYLPRFFCFRIFITTLSYHIHLSRIYSSIPKLKWTEICEIQSVAYGVVLFVSL